MPRTSGAAFLQGIRIVDLSQYISGPFASLMLGDFGADVIKIEPPAGDAMRRLGPRSPDGAALFHGVLNAQKTVLHLDLKTPIGLDALYGLLADCDVLIEGFRPGVMARLGLSHDDLKARFPQLIYCSISGYGATGPRALSPGHDGNFLASSGIMARNGVDAPVFFDPPLADMAGGLYATVAILAALHGRRTTQQGVHIDIGLADTLMPLQLMQVAAWSIDRTEVARQSTYLNGGAAYYYIYPTADGRHVMVGAVEPKFWRNLCTIAGHDEWINRQDEPCPQTDLRRDVARYFLGFTLDEAMTRFAGADCCVSAVQNLGEALTDPHLRARGLVQSGSQGLQTAFPALFDGQALPPRQPLGQASIPGEAI